MNPVQFPEANKNLLKPASMSDDECGSLPVYNDGVESISCWQLTWGERLQALLWGRIWLGVMFGQTQPPVRLWCLLTPFQTSRDYLLRGPQKATTK